MIDKIIINNKIQEIEKEKEKGIVGFIVVKSRRGGKFESPRVLETPLCGDLTKSHYLRLLSVFHLLQTTCALFPYIFYLFILY